jgi:hypothetical protein
MPPQRAPMRPQTNVYPTGFRRPPGPRLIDELRRRPVIEFPITSPFATEALRLEKIGVVEIRVDWRRRQLAVSLIEPAPRRGPRGARSRAGWGSR